MTAVTVAQPTFGAAPVRAAAEPAPARLPWGVDDLLRLVALNGAVLGGLAVAWFGTSGTVLLQTAANWTVLGIAALIVQGCANIGWLLRGRRTIGERRARLLEAFEQLPEVAAPVLQPATAARGAVTSAAPAATELVVVPGATRFHRADCQLAVGKTVVAETREEHDRAGRVACGVCAP